MFKNLFKMAIIVKAILFFSLPGFSKNLLVQSSTSLKNSGFYKYIIPEIKENTGINLNIIAVGSGQAIKNATNCDGDLLITHAKEAELAFLNSGFGLERSEFMFSNWLVIGSKRDAQLLAKSSDISDAFLQIYNNKNLFISRGDNSGTHIREMNIWGKVNLKPENFLPDWYLEVGSGQGATLNTAIELEAFTLTDSATWFSYKNKGSAIVAFKDKNELNIYSLITINPLKCPSTKLREARKVINFLKSAKGKTLISNFVINREKIFFSF